MESAERKIIHVDMDCFYAAVEIRDNPRLKGRPVAVGGHPSGRGVITTANYEARKFGVKSALSVRAAIKMCPQLELVPINFSKYKNESKKIREIFYKYTSLVQPLSLDEAYLDVSHCNFQNGSATLIAQVIRSEIFKATGLTASAGIANSKFLAKVASDWNKPNGQFTVAPDQVSAFVAGLDLNKIPGIGKVTFSKLKRLGFTTCADVQKLALSDCEAQFGQWGLWLYDIVRGIDNRQVRPDSGERKSLSLERTYPKDLTSFSQCCDSLPKLIENLRERVRRAKIESKIKGVFVKLKFNDFTQTTHESCTKRVINYHVFSALLEAAYYRHDKPVRLIGLGVRLETKPNKKKSSQMELNI